MTDQPFLFRSFPRAIVHIDGDAFFASCEQARHPKLQGKPVITGKERGIVASMSYEAKARGVTRGMRLFEVRRVCPDAILLPSDYETYSLLSQRFFAIVRRYTPDVEEYSIDECFADLTGLRRPLRLSYRQMAERIKQDVDTALGFTFSVGLAPTKVLAKIASKWQKPSGLTVIPGPEISQFLRTLPVEKVWGIGAQTTAFLAKQGVTTALALAQRPEAWVRQQLSKPCVEIWQELRGQSVLPLVTAAKSPSQSIQKVQTFTPPSADPTFVFAQLAKNIEHACLKARTYRVAAKTVFLLLKTQQFTTSGVEVTFSRRTAFPQEMLPAIRPAFEQLCTPRILYRATGVVLQHLAVDDTAQLDLFGDVFRVEKLTRLYDAVDRLRTTYGKHTVFLGASLPAHQFAQHLGERGDLPERHRALLKGETARKRLGIPMWLGDVT